MFRVIGQLQQSYMIMSARRAEKLSRFNLFRHVEHGLSFKIHADPRTGGKVGEPRADEYINVNMYECMYICTCKIINMRASDGEGT